MRPLKVSVSKDTTGVNVPIPHTIDRNLVYGSVGRVLNSDYIDTLAPNMTCPGALFTFTEDVTHS